jgi:hypothetical protein
MRWAAHPRGVAALAMVFLGAAALSLASAFADPPTRAQAGDLSTLLGALTPGLSVRFALPAAALASLLLAVAAALGFPAARKPARPPATPARYAPYALPARVTVALAAAARARNLR